MSTTTPKFNSKSPTIRRILREAHELTASPSADYHAVPLETDLFEWHFTLRGPPKSAFESGIYHGRIVLPPSYPLRPPSFRFLTPSGRFETNREICLSISGHHEETWQPAWGIRTALVALRTFMETDVKGQLGGLEAAEPVRRRLADESKGWRCGACCGGKTNAEILADCEERVKELRGGEEGGKVKEEEEVKVPEELKMGWRDEMEGSKKGQEGHQSEEGDGGGDGESDALAEGFVQTTSPGEASRSERPLRPVQGSTVSPPTRTVPLPGPLPAAAGPALQQVQRRVADETTVWLDRLIFAVAVLLVAVVAKVMLA
ncbi:ubiquitin-conjugating enzyme/RWD-like protein [Corynascus novoguineensis]|uniref:Ubiquitin-conjugating enzyme/RWD-like protein n=1 Tax=Corynascus novoguineensis TaxID=1126955 RepID=A0AAN7HHK9_9PEZI|nr:ubiquitin-conjugating enzyme/RWD-like protein [Corynascus novoguineensis]